MWEIVAFFPNLLLLLHFIDQTTGYWLWILILIGYLEEFLTTSEDTNAPPPPPTHLNIFAFQKFYDKENAFIVLVAVLKWINALFTETHGPHTWGCTCTLTQPQSCQSTQVSPGQWGQRAPVLNLGEVEDEGHTGDEDEVEEAHGGKEVGHLSKAGTAQKHLEQHLVDEEKINQFISVTTWVLHLNSVQRRSHMQSDLV